MRSTRALAISILTALALNGCNCDGKLQKVAPKIEIGDPFDTTTSICTDTGIRDCSYAFGDVAIGQGRFFKFLIMDPSPVSLLIKNIAFADGSDPAFTIESVVPTKVESASDSYRGEEITIRFAPAVESEIGAQLVIESDAVNLNTDENVVINFVGVGADLGRPEIEVTPGECDFGDVGVGATAECPLSIRNIGDRDLEIQGVGFSDSTDTTVFGSTTFVPLGTFLAFDQALTVTMTATPPMAADYSGSLIITTNDPVTPEMTIPLTMRGAEAPTAIGEIYSVNGSVVLGNAPAVVAPLDDVVITGENSIPARPGDSIASYQWEIVSQPAESTVVLTDPTAMRTGFQFNNGFTDLHGLDVVGVFEIALTVTDSNGAVSGNNARVILNAEPTEALHIQATWDIDSGDIDLHLIRNGGAYCGDDSCYYGNCKATNSFNYPEWDGVNGRSVGDPSLDVDDLSGYGPENINIDNPVDGNYTVAVSYYSGGTPAYVTVKIFVNGALQHEDGLQLNAGGDFWTVADIAWAGNAIITPVNDTTVPTGTCLNSAF